MESIREELIYMQDLEYKKFHSSLMPTVDKELIIGIRVPVLRKYAKELFRCGDGVKFIETLPHKYFEEYNLHAFIVEQIKDFDTALYETNRLLPYIDNWATCDMFFPKVFKKNEDKMAEIAYGWVSSDKTYIIRYGIGVLMKMYLDDDFKEEYLDKVAKIKSDEYYVNMMIAWYFATALAKQYEKTIPFITERRLSIWVHNKTIQKAIESNRIDKETKAYLKTLKI